MSNPLDNDQADLAEAFGAISSALDDVPEGRESVFLAKLLLVLCQDVAIARVRQGISVALEDIAYAPGDTSK